MEEKSFMSSIFALRVTAGQEKNAAELIGVRVKALKLPVLSILAPLGLKGYIFVEAESRRGPHALHDAVSGMRHVKTRAIGKMLSRIQYDEIEKYIVTKPVIEELEIGYIVEITGGPFRGMKARITKVNRMKSEATLELFEATFTLPITVSADYLKLIEKKNLKDLEEEK